MASLKEERLESYLIDGQERFYRLAYSYLQNREEALDAVQTAVCRALERRDSLRDPGAVKPGLPGFCSTPVRTSSAAGPGWSPSRRRSRARRTRNPRTTACPGQVDALPREVGTVIKLRFYEELSLKEISQITGQNLSTVKSRLYAGLKKLRVAMEGAEI